MGKFAPSTFLGVIPEGSLVVGEVFPVSHQQPSAGLTFPGHDSREFTTTGGMPLTEEVHRGHDGDPRTPPAGFSKQRRPWSVAEIDVQARYEPSKLRIVTTTDRPEVYQLRPLRGFSTHPIIDRDNGKPYDPGNAIDYSGIPGSKPKQLYYMDYVTESAKPNQVSGQYVSDGSQEKPIHEHTSEVIHDAFPPAGPLSVGATDKHVNDRGRSSHWQKLLRFVSTVLPIGLLLAAITPNVLVVSPSVEAEAGKDFSRPSTMSSIKRSFEDPCTLRSLCETLSESTASFHDFLKAAEQGATTELEHLIKAAEMKKCKSISCAIKPSEA